MFQAWQTARLSHFSGKKLKSLPELLRDLKPRKPVRKQTAEEMVAALRAIKATMGG